MNAAQWQIFSQFRNSFKAQVAAWSQNPALMQTLQQLQSQSAQKDGVPAYRLETPVVYNNSLDEVTPQTDIKAIIVGDNPGKDEQLTVNNRYLVGQSGKVANSWFKKHPELGIDFRANTIILNKTPVHTAKTKELNVLSKQDPAVAQLIADSTRWMAEQTCRLHADLCSAADGNQLPQLWLVGYGELSGKGVFIPYRNILSSFYTSDPAGIPWKDQVGVFQHFSMNRFFIDVDDHSDPQLSLQQNLTATGALHRSAILGF